MLELELFEVDFLFIIGKTKIRDRVLTAFKLFFRNRDAKTGLTIGGLGVEFRAKTIFEIAHYTTARI